METIIATPERPDQLEALKAFLSALKINFKAEVADDSKTFYSPEFEAKMKRAEEDEKAGRFKTIKTAELWK